jgi:hypothetical protein
MGEKAQLITDPHRATRTCRIHGMVYAHRYLVPPAPLVPDRTLPGARLDFYEVNNPLPTMNRCLGTAFSARDGGYDFSFDLGLSPGGGKPDIKVRIWQFRDGAWSQVYESTLDWHISKDFVKDFLIPAEDVYFPPTATPPSNGFRPIALGFLPLDAQRISDGYATSEGKNPVQFSHQPFCETLRIFGLFGTGDKVGYYKVKVSPAKKDPVTDNWTSATGEWEDVVDPLNNLQWHDVMKRWEWRVLGPDPVTHLYTNIDVQPEADWFEHALKVTWNSANKPDGYYLLKVVPCDVNGHPLSTPPDLPVLCIDNTLPEAGLSVSSPIPTGCGVLTLPANREVHFTVTAYSASGNMFEYALEGYRGLNDESAGSGIDSVRSPVDQNWTGVLNEDRTFAVAQDNSGCTVMAYSFRLMVQGSATNGYSSLLESRRVWRETNLVVQK